MHYGDPGDEHQEGGPNPAIADWGKDDVPFEVNMHDYASVVAELFAERATSARLREERDDSDRCLLGAAQALYSAKEELDRGAEAQVEIEELHYLIEDAFIALQRRRFEEDVELRELRQSLWNVIRNRERA